MLTLQMYCVIEGLHSAHTLKSPEQFHVFIVYYLLVRRINWISSATSCSTNDNRMFDVSSDIIQCEAFNLCNGTTRFILWRNMKIGTNINRISEKIAFNLFFSAPKSHGEWILHVNIHCWFQIICIEWTFNTPDLCLWLKRQIWHNFKYFMRINQLQ